MSCRIQSISYLCIRQWRPRIYLGIVPRGRFPGRFIIQHLFCLLLTSSRSKASQKHHRLLVFLEVILFSQRCLYLFILVSEIPFPPRAEVDMPSPEPSYQRLRIFVILCPERTGFTTILFCHIVIIYHFLYPNTTSSTIIRANPTAKPTVPKLECSPFDVSGISSSTTTYNIAPAANASK